MLFRSGGANLNIYQTGNVFSTLSVSEVDSVTFSKGTENVSPIVATSLITEIGSDHVRTGVNVISVGSSSIVEKGICWNTKRNPTISINKKVIGNDVNAACFDLTGLEANTTYYIRSYVRSESGVTTYGNQSIVMTRNNMPVVQTTSATYNRTTKAVSFRGKVIEDGGSSITEVGVCWGTSNNPTIEDSKYTMPTIPSGSFSYSITGLDTEYDYFVRSYAVNANGVSYGKPIRVIPVMGNVSYSLAGAVSPENMGQSSYNLLVEALDSACYYMNKYTGYVANIWVDYHEGVTTAGAGYWSQMKCGANQRYMYVGTVLHEMCHYFGSGTHWKWVEYQTNQTPMVNTNAKLAEITNGMYTSISLGGSHYWPFGCNQREEVATQAGYNNEEYLKIMAKLIWEMRLDCDWRTY